MVAASHRQGDLFESPPTYGSIPIEAHQQMLELLKELLTEALTDSATEVHDVGGENGGE
ncbi:MULTISPECIES: hypothetical protein [Bradyrhizobium]|jgi:hypothetical protein|uniref:Uncharacterized protein n=1 Tax=Bradyrhizobium elkanii TaxID=29448 RepID=A0A8I2C0B2_BRAEL|nr:MULTISPECIES: hypothetical protein [Bradyrhizobium]MBP1293615.1 hypothetical protein [Bradyrhizobium elkanii]MCP1925801.1 hypothetical protein [Bradyrhizobium elkanii]MCS3451435.1 hypothetical protein [Bradyrhizobium elkanii]MCS3476707.1 hypothetical protein [Bradyrhizobium elkanii]MCS3566540.1 hypothetical protein [Bradyrhizobium elkanii]